MKVKIGDKIISSQDGPIAIMLNTKEKNLISKLPAGQDVFVSCPVSEKDISKIREWAEDGWDVNAVEFGAGSKLILPRGH